MQHFAKVFAKRAAVPTAVAVGACSAQARVSPNVRDPNTLGPIAKLEDEWMLPSVDGNRVLFKPYNGEEIDQCCDEISALFSARAPAGSSVTISELSPEGSEYSHGASADNVIEAADATHGPANPQNELTVLLSLASKMLRRPGLQTEVFACMMEDAEVRELLATRCDDLDSYLLAAGVPMGSNRFLLGGDTASAAGSTSTADDAMDGTSREGPDFMATVIGAVSTLLQRTGGALAFLGGWLRDRFAFMAPPPPASGDGPSAGAPGSGHKKSTDAVLVSVMVLVVAIICMLVVRRPIRFRCV